jgi:hypothetical protein
VARPRKGRITNDDILDSLTRPAELRQKLGKNDQVRLEEIAEIEDLSLFQGLNYKPAPASKMAEKGSFAHLAFVFMLLVGLTVAGLYGSLSKPIDLASLNAIIQKSGVSSIFANPAQLGIIALAAVIGALWIRHRRRVSSLHLLLN